MAEQNLEGSNWHRIKLPAPWQLSTLPGDQGLQYLRQFQRPTGLTAQSRVALEVRLRDSDSSSPPSDNCPLEIAIQLNGNDLEVARISELVYQTAIQPAQLLPFNQLAIRLRTTDSTQRQHYLTDALESVALLLPS